MSTERRGPGAGRGTLDAAEAQPRGATCPWLTVLPLAVVLAFADGFWVTSLRGAVGAIERTQSPFASWLRESTARPSALRPRGARRPHPGPALVRAVRRTGPRQVLTSLAAGRRRPAPWPALAGLAASSVYDYHLQPQQCT